jgi:hypothetical protein
MYFQRWHCTCVKRHLGVSGPANDESVKQGFVSKKKTKKKPGSKLCFFKSFFFSLLAQTEVYNTEMLYTVL